jgi:hypothetical protein
MVFHNFSTNSPVVHTYQNRCNARVWGSCAGFHCGEVWGLRLLLRLFSTAQAYESVES